jgi:hypothetical protein
MEEKSGKAWLKHLPFIVIACLLMVNASLNYTNLLQYRSLLQTLKQPVVISNAPQAVNTANLDTIRDELVQIRAEQRKLNQVLGSSKSLENLSDFLIDPQVTATQSVSIKDPKFTSIDVYASPQSSAKIVSQLTFGHSYPVISSSAGWYQIKVLENLTGYVSSNLVSLINNL